MILFEREQGLQRIGTLGRKGDYLVQADQRFPGGDMQGKEFFGRFKRVQPLGRLGEHPAHGVEYLRGGRFFEQSLDLVDQKVGIEYFRELPEIGRSFLFTRFFQDRNGSRRGAAGDGFRLGDGERGHGSRGGQELFQVRLGRRRYEHVFLDHRARTFGVVDQKPLREGSGKLIGQIPIVPLRRHRIGGAGFRESVRESGRERRRSLGERLRSGSGYQEGGQRRRSGESQENND